MASHLSSAKYSIIAILFLFSFSKVDAQQQTFGGNRINFLVEGHPGFVIQPPEPAKKGRKPWAWYAPTIGKYPNKSNVWLMERLVQNGFWICGMDVGESMGNPEGCRLFSMFYDSLIFKYKLDKKGCLIPQSRGGLMLYNWAEDPSNSGKVSRIAGIYPVCNLQSYPGLAKAAAVYGVNPDTFQIHLKEYNPIDNLESLYKAGVKIFHIHGDNDKVVPLDQNSQIVYDRYRAMGGDIKLVVIPGKGHEEIPEYFQSQEMLKFLLKELSPRKKRKRNS